jgi:esterase/lipase superfamily enzyme
MRLALTIWLVLALQINSPAFGQKPKTPDRKLPDIQSPFARHVTNLYGQALSNSPLMLSRELTHCVWRVFYATNRVRIVGEQDRRISYGPLSASPPRLEYGECEVVLPVRQLRLNPSGPASPKEKSFAASQPPAELSCRELQPIAYNRFFEELVRTVSQAPQRDVLVYVHGYNTGFEDAMFRAAELAQNMPFNGVVISYCWPSAGSNLAYSKDVDSADATVKHLWRFLSALHTYLGNGTRINLVGQGLGCRALLQGVASIPKNVRELRPFQHLVLISPDIGTDKFPTLAEKCTVATRHLTLYVSQSDESLVAAKNFVRNSQLVGDASNLVIVPRVDTVDVSLANRGFLSGAQQPGNRTLLTELFQLIKLDNPPAQRPWLRAAKQDGKIYWQFVNETPNPVQAERPTLKK